MRTNHSHELMQMDEAHRENNGSILPKQKRHICEYCGHVFSRLDNLKVHVRRDHASGTSTYDSYTPVPYESTQSGGGGGGVSDSESLVRVLQREEAVNGFVSSHRIVASADPTGDPAAMFRWSMPCVTTIIYAKLLELDSLKFQLALKVVYAC
ncbi:MAG: C2H2-type zinc finger protein [Gammaproteobacteria bacterium]|nr:C2H2-type zinc finger protein [Gammaproteobacteria bacterium]